MRKETVKPYELLEHTADAKFRAYGKTREEAFANAVQGMTAIVADPQHLDKSLKRDVRVTGRTLQTLLFNLLDEILFLHDTEHLLPAAAEGLRIAEASDGFSLNATLVGDDARKWPGNLKAVTYSEMIVEEQKDGTWLLQAVIDI